MIFHVDLSPGNFVGFNKSMAEIAREFIVGPSAASVDDRAPILDGSQRLPAEHCETLWPSHRMQIVHELEWYRLASAIQYPATDPRCGRFAIDWKAVAQGWHPLPYLATNLPEFPTGLRLHGNSIALLMTGYPGFTDRNPDEPLPREEAGAQETPADDHDFSADH